jgi:hypothetical protein
MADNRPSLQPREKSLNLLYESFGLFVQWPLAALGPAALFLAAYFWKRGALCGLASTLWVIYTGYELLMKWRVLCSGECNIRVDLLVLYPALFVVSLAAIVELVVKKRKAPDGAP